MEVLIALYKSVELSNDAILFTFLNQVTMLQKKKLIFKCISF